jgi:hypothetical protein
MVVVKHLWRGDAGRGDNPPLSNCLPNTGGILRGLLTVTRAVLVLYISSE